MPRLYTFRPVYREILDFDIPHYVHTQLTTSTETSCLAKARVPVTDFAKR